MYVSTEICNMCLQKCAICLYRNVQYEKCSILIRHSLDRSPGRARLWEIKNSHKVFCFARYCTVGKYVGSANTLLMMSVQNKPSFTHQTQNCSPLALLCSDPESFRELSIHSATRMSPTETYEQINNGQMLAVSVLTSFTFPSFVTFLDEPTRTRMEPWSDP